jgi:ankyrin repeat protein
MAPTEEQVQELLLSCRYGELDEVKAFTDEFGWEDVNKARDDRGNTVLHMICANGHLGGCRFLLDQTPMSMPRPAYSWHNARGCETTGPC